MEDKKLAAATAAVFTYIKTGEEALAMQMHLPQEDLPEPVQPAGPMSPLNLWGISGRQNMMQANTMMQLRMFK